MKNLPDNNPDIAGERRYAGPDMARYNKRSTRIQTKSTRRTTVIILLILISIPLFSLYLGYLIGEYIVAPRYHLSDNQVNIDHYALNRSMKHTHYLTFRFDGGMGNRMFEYASMYGMAEANFMKPLVPMDNVLRNTFPNLEAKGSDIPVPGSGWPKFREMRPYSFDEKAFSLNFEKDIEVQGYFQSWRYFDHVKEEIVRQFTFPDKFRTHATVFLNQAFNKSKQQNAFSQEIGINKIQFVGIHVRRGDFLDAYNKERGYTVATQAYILNAMAYFEDKYRHVIFVVCSDDMVWSQEQVTSSSNPIAFSPRGSATFDLCLLSMCNHTIMTVGSFGWWAAYLAGGETVYYKDFPRRYSQIERTFSPSDYYYPDWYPM